MNKVILMGRLCADPEVRYSQNENQTTVARYRLAVDRRFKREGDQTADFIPCIAFGKAAEFAEKYLRQVKYVLIPAQYEHPESTTKKGRGRCVERECTYIADFVYKTILPDGDTLTIVEDTKGFRTKDYIIKRKLMLSVYGIRIREI